MQRYSRLELSVGAFVLAGAGALAYLAFTLGELSLSGQKRYAITARFSSIGDLKVGDPVKLAGVTVGEVAGVRLADFVAETELSVDQEVKLPKDTIASIQSSGLLGDAYISLSPGAADDDLPPNGQITRTEPAISIMELVSKYAFGSAVDDEGSGTSEAKPKGESRKQQDDGHPSPFSDPLE